MAAASRGVPRRSSVASYVREMISYRPALRECLALGLVNHSALARLLQKEMAAQGLRASLSAVKMTLIRAGEAMRGQAASYEEKILAVLAGSVLELRSDLVLLVARRAAVQRGMEGLLRLARGARFFQLTQGVEVFVITLSREDEEEARRLLGAGILRAIGEQAALVIISPEEIYDTPGFIAFVTSHLASRGINITQILSCHSDTVLVVHRDDAARAYRLLDELLTYAKKMK